MAGEQPARPGCGATAARRPVRDRVARRVPPRPDPAALRLVGPAGVFGRALDHAGTIDAGLSGRERHPLPRLQHMFEHLQLPRAGRAGLGTGRGLRGPAMACTRGRMQTVNHRSRMRPQDADRAAAGRNRSWRVSAACSGQARGQKEATGLSDAAGHLPKARLSAQLGKIAGDATQIRRYLQPRPATGSARLAAACSAPADLRHKGSVVERQAEGWWAVDDRQVMNDVVFGEPVDGIFTGRARATDAQIIEKLRARGCDAGHLLYRDPLAHRCSVIADPGSPLNTPG
jgi:hypothetical protein